MTDNEKRAHDLAIATVPIVYEAAKSNTIANGAAESHIDLYGEYIRLYQKLLGLFNSEFPEGK